MTREELELALPGLFGEFDRLVRGQINAGHRRVSARGVVHAIRVEAAARGRAWRINDHTSPLLARVWLAENPEWLGTELFELRASRFDGGDPRQPELFGSWAA